MDSVLFAALDPKVRSAVLEVRPEARPWRPGLVSRLRESIVLVVGSEFLIRHGIPRAPRARFVVFVAALDARHVEAAARMRADGASLVTCARELADEIDSPRNRCQMLFHWLSQRRAPRLVRQLVELVVNEPETRGASLSANARRLASSRSALYRACEECNCTPGQLVFAGGLAAALDDYSGPKLSMVAHKAGYASEGSLRRAVRAAGMRTDELRDDIGAMCRWLDRTKACATSGTTRAG